MQQLFQIEEGFVDLVGEAHFAGKGSSERIDYVGKIRNLQGEVSSLVKELAEISTSDWSSYCSRFE